MAAGAIQRARPSGKSPVAFSICQEVFMSRLLVRLDPDPRRGGRRAVLPPARDAERRQTASRRWCRLKISATKASAGAIAVRWARWRSACRRSPALGQDAPESLLPPGFDDPAPAPAPPAGARPPRPASRRRAAADHRRAADAAPTEERRGRTGRGRAAAKALADGRCARRAAGIRTALARSGRRARLRTGRGSRRCLRRRDGGFLQGLMRGSTRRSRRAGCRSCCAAR